MDKITIGILAHVDAGKTTLTEAMLYKTGYLRKKGRVDHQDAFLDNSPMERARGITIFSKQAVFPLGDKEITLLDTPGHVDFSAETERTFQVLDYAILVVSGTDGVQSHTKTIWNLLKQYHIPVFLFVNKMDQPDTERHNLIEQLKKELDSNCVDFTEEKKEVYHEELAMCDEQALEQFMENGIVEEENIAQMIRMRKVYPCYFGSALQLEGVNTLLSGLLEYMRMPDYPQEFGAKVYKISRDAKGARLTHLKITGGTLPVKMAFSEIGKVDQIRIYSGEKFETRNEVGPGTICAVTGLSNSFVGQGLGRENLGFVPTLAPLLTYRMILPTGKDPQKALEQLKQIEEEDPQLHIVWNSYLEEVNVQLMGEVQTEILKAMIKERFDMDVSFDAGHIVYKETITEPVIGVGHYEPLRHYAHVVLLLRPGEPGSGLKFGSVCKEDDLDRNWQRLILTHLQEKEHIGVLAGMPITDMEIILLGGRAHQKHTEGGDFRQATYRAVRQGLRRAKSRLLEPYYDFKLELPSDQIGRAMSDIQQMHGSCEPTEVGEESAVLSGKAPAAGMIDYQQEVWAYTGGKGRLTVNLGGYEPCHNEEEIIEEIGYNPDRDLENTADSIYCSHGAGFTVPWDEIIVPDQEEEEEQIPINHPSRQSRVSSMEEDAELLAIMEREFGSESQRRDKYMQSRRNAERRVDFSDRKSEAPSRKDPSHDKPIPRKKQYLLVDGYNIIFAWDELNELSKHSLAAARQKLMDILSNYQGYTQCTLILVFDAYKVEQNPGSIQKYHNIYVVFTKESETADQYIEKTTHEIGKKHHVTVATSDRLEQVIIMGAGANRLSATDFAKEVEHVEHQIREVNRQKKENGRNYLLEDVDQKTAEQLEEIRLGKRKQ